MYFCMCVSKVKYTYIPLFTWPISGAGVTELILYLLTTNLCPPTDPFTATAPATPKPDRTLPPSQTGVRVFYGSAFKSFSNGKNIRSIFRRESRPTRTVVILWDPTVPHCRLCPVTRIPGEPPPIHCSSAGYITVAGTAVLQSYTAFTCTNTQHSPGQYYKTMTDLIRQPCDQPWLSAGCPAWRSPCPAWRTRSRRASWRRARWRPRFSTRGSRWPAQ